ncbi:MAG: class I SAM-dependent methyltransferase [Ardenticatenaceae bacterium]|nr:class I SAM-dependent methyltransferase [Ardenticatenaceae bacterium]MCB8987203.1 class I SAM-dependent methyltransferase [Ardenticatenaceae bacterium]
MVELSGLTGTLLFTLRARAEEDGRADHLFADPLAAQWYEQIPQPEAARQALEALYSPVFQLGTAVRARFFDDVTQRFLAARQRPIVVELGAGLSTRFARLGVERALWWELDLPEAIAVRRLVDVETAQHRFLPFSMLDEAWTGEMTAVPAADILFIAEGVLFFLAPAEVAALFQMLSRHFPGATFALDVLTEEFSTSARQRFAAHGAPLQWFLADEAAVYDLGLAVAQTAVAAHQSPARWRGLGFDPHHLQSTQVNILLETRII